MKFGEHFLEELKARVRVSDVVGKHVKLKRQGRELAGLSPFTNEKTPSFFVNDEKGFYHCFSSGKHGDGISFLMEFEGLSFPEAVEQIANMAGMDMPKADPDAERRAASNKKTINWIEAAQVFYQKSLFRELGKTARDYLKTRGLTKEDCQRFGIGYAPDSFNAQRDELTQQGASLERLIEAGLLIRPEDSNKQPWDRFRHRIMFPITDPRGRLIAFGGRALKQGEKAKYLNSPETNLFHKGKLLYRYPEARKALHAPNNGARGMIVAEGYMDVIALAKAGFGHAVAPLGTALTEEQLALLWRAGPEPTLCFDGDKAGQRAAFRSVERALPLLKPGQTLRFTLLPDGQDPDDLISAKGPAAMQEVLDKSIPLVDMLWLREMSAERLDTPEAKAGLKDRIFSALREITHEGVRDQYKTALLAKFDAEFGRPKWTPNKNTGNWKAKTKLTNSQIHEAQPKALQTARERRILGAILEWPALLEHIDQTLFSLQFHAKPCIDLQNSLLNYWQDTISVDKRALHAHIESDGLAKLLGSFKRDRNLTIAALGGQDTEGESGDIKRRVKLWIAEAKALDANKSGTGMRNETRGRMVDTIRAENTDAMQRLMRSSREERSS